eukprot:scaffold7994_cov122-Isochrysis_galbana.AAC.4
MTSRPPSRCRAPRRGRRRAPPRPRYPSSLSSAPGPAGHTWRGSPEASSRASWRHPCRLESLARADDGRAPRSVHIRLAQAPSTVAMGSAAARGLTGVRTGESAPSVRQGRLLSFQGEAEPFAHPPAIHAESKGD